MDDAKALSKEETLEYCLELATREKKQLKKCLNIVSNIRHFHAIAALCFGAIYKEGVS